MMQTILFALALSPTLAVSTMQQSSNFMEKSEVTVNPIRKVLAVLEHVQKKVAEEGEKEKQMYDRFMCYCDKSDGTLAGSIAAGKNKVSELTSNIAEHSAQKAQLLSDLRAARAARVEAKDAMQAATVLREKEASANAKDTANLKSNIGALRGAIVAIAKGVGGGAFLQTSTAAIVRKIALTGPSMNDADRQDLMSFLSGEHSSSYVPQSEQITGILKDLADGMEKSLADATSSETDSINSYEGLISAKTKQVEALEGAIESKSKRVGELAVTIAMESTDHDDTSEAVAEDTKFLADLTNNCNTKKAEWADIVQMRANEAVAIADTIKLLSDDEALELFKKTLPGASFIQLETSADAMRTKALSILTKARRSAHPAGLALEFIDLALHGKKIGFEKVIKMIDNMVAQLKQEQANDNDKKEYCEKEFDSSDDKKKNLDQQLADLETSISSAQEGIASVKAELEQLDDGIKALDKSVADATDQRKAEHADYTELISNDGAAKDLLGLARNRLNKFYHPKEFKPPSSREALVQSMGAGSDAPPPPPEAPGAFKKQDSSNMIAMLDQIVADLDKEVQTAGVDEKYAQKEYEQTMANSATKRAQDAKLINEKESMKAELESDLQDDKAGKSSTTKALMGTLEYISGLHNECDWLLKNMEVRTQARTSEIESLVNAKGVLSGVDVSFVQRKSLRARQQQHLSP